MHHSPRHCDLLLFAGHLVTQNTTRTVHADAGIAVQDGRVAALGARHELEQDWIAGRRLDFPEGVIFPGFINGHTHAAMSWFRGLADDLPLMDWLQRHIFPAEQRHTPRTVELGALLSCAEMLAAGITCFADMHFWADAVARAAHTAGMRAMVGEVIFGFPTPASPTVKAALERSHALREQLQHDERRRICVAPHSVYTTTAAMLTHAAALSDLWKCPLCIHAAESPAETAQSLSQHGRRPLEHLDALGLLGPRTVLAHGVDLLPREIELLAARGAAVIHNPRSNMKLASGVAPVPELLAAGVPVGLGTDGSGSNNQLNLFAEMSACALLHKGTRKQADTLPAQTVLDMATCNAADALRWPELGRLVVDGPADLAVVDGSLPHLQPMADPISHAVYSMHGGEVTLTMVAGEILYENNRHTRIDLDALRREMQDCRFAADARPGAAA
ncbi:amidohydrolase family protein [Megalodesulfovibrio gigas]|uniref:Putative Guanine deaminase n=1 Tax=Megalodesulfovibrio gigas (strain ATCC 19364 / DSM 1382 / NCIMB 9332 / VKM B-1759) TaxID=1121448 RepID=T2GDU6_MEGG1|nr:amidohydrolase [Megalodesulfovibrio gigas]AGW14478.1 putative Guanine deaminase [Megalodesulfovibrio gigas DSM 1382 = ATCC 19364]